MNDKDQDVGSTWFGCRYMQKFILYKTLGYDHVLPRLRTALVYSPMVIIAWSLVISERKDININIYI